MVLKIIIGAVLVAVVGFAAAWCAASEEISRLEIEELKCSGCFWEEHCSHEDGLKLCVDGANGFEDAPWESF